LEYWNHCIVTFLTCEHLNLAAVKNEYMCLSWAAQMSCA
jgi:hypothetical protein